MDTQLSFSSLCAMLQQRKGIALGAMQTKQAVKKYYTARLFSDAKKDPGVLYVRPSGEFGELLGEDESVCSLNCNYVELYNSTIALFEELSDWEARMQKASWMPDALTEIITIAREVIPHPMYVADPGYKIYAMSDHPDMCQMSYSWNYAWNQGYLPLDIILSLSESQELRKSKYTNHAHLTSSESFYTRFTNYVVKESGRIYGHFFVIEIIKPIQAYEMELIQIVGNAIRQALIQNTQFSVTAGSLYQHFIIDVLEGTLTNKKLINSQLEALVLADCWRFAVVRIAPAGFDQANLQSIRNIIEKKVKNTIAVLHQRGITIIGYFPDSSYVDTFVSEMHYVLESAKVSAGMSDLFEDFTQVTGGLNQANAALGAANGLSQARLVLFSSVAFKDFVNSSAQFFDLQGYVYPGLWQLEKYDEANGTCLVDTLRSYLENDRVAGTTANQLFIHRNTLIKRLDKIQALSGIDLEDYLMVKRLILSFEILEALKGE